MKKLLQLATCSLLGATIVFASGYKVPEVSTDTVALSAANIAHWHGADTAYYNPANMIFMPDVNSLEVDAISIRLDAVKFKGSGKQAGEEIHAEGESFLVPSINYVSSKLGNTRVGLSIVVPGGLSKRWTQSPALDKAKEFTLEVLEINPTVAFKVNNDLAVAVGFRGVYSSGVVKSTSSASRDMTGNSIDVGYNLALAYKPTNALEVGLTYRSKVDLTVAGNAKLHIGDALVYNGGASVGVPLPAAWNAAVAYTFQSDTTIEIVYEKTLWSAYSLLDFHYRDSITPILVPYFDNPIKKNWNDTEAYRLGITQKLQNMTLMAGAVYDNSPIPDETLNYELPDSNSWSLSLGGRYSINKKMSLGLSGLYSMRKNRDVKNSETEGTFSHSNVLIMSVGLGYKF